MDLSGESYRVLVVDDEETIRSLMDVYIKGLGHRYRIAAHGMEALEALEEADFDIMITDLNMPVINGLELIRRARMIRPEMVSILLTGVGTRQDTIAALKEGVYDYLEKPISHLSILKMAIDRAGTQARLIRERNQLLEDLRQKNKKLEINFKNLNEAYERLLRQEEALTSDLRQAQRMQQSMLPRDFPRMAGFGFYGYYCPCERLGGDFFDVLPIDENRMAIYLADVAGHGVRAAMTTVIIRELLHAEQLLHPDQSIYSRPADVLQMLNQALLEEHLDENLHVTMGYLVIDGAAGRIVYSSAGHPPPAICTGGAKLTYPRPKGPALTMEANPRYEALEFYLAPGDTMLLFSDGLTEARNAQGEDFTTARLQNMAHLCHTLKVIEAGGALEKALAKHLRHMAPADDVSYVMIRRLTAEEEADGALHSAVKVVSVDATRAPDPTEPDGLSVGWSDGALVAQLCGHATWQYAHTLREIIQIGLDKGANGIYLDLSQTRSLDSTMLGFLNQSAGALLLCQPSDKIYAAFQEVGIADKLHILCEPAPETHLRPVGSREIRQTDQARLILSAHESLAEMTPENQQKFGPVINLLREQTKEERD